MTYNVQCAGMRKSHVSRVAVDVELPFPYLYAHEARTFPRAHHAKLTVRTQTWRPQPFTSARRVFCQSTLNPSTLMVYVCEGQYR